MPSLFDSRGYRVARHSENLRIPEERTTNYPLPIYMDDFDDQIDMDAIDSEDFLYVPQGLVLGPDGNMLNLSDFEFDMDSFVDSGEPVLVENSSSGTVDISLPISLPISNDRLVAMTIFVLFFLIGIVGNALVVSTASRFGGMRKVTYLYLVNLSVANLVYLLVCLPTVTASYILVDWPFGVAFCRMENYIMSVSMSVSVMTIVATGLDRYLAIVFPVGSKKYRSTRNTMWVILCIWVLSLSLMTARIHLFNIESVYHIVGKTKLCIRVANNDNLKVDTVLCCLFLYILPQIVLVFCHVKIGQTIWRSGRVGSRHERSHQGGLFGIRERRRIAKIVIAINIVFGIGWLPVHLYHLVEDFDNGNILFGEVVDRGTVALLFSFGANALNPLIYCVISGTYRKHFKNAFLCRKSTFVSSVERQEHQVNSFRRPVNILQPRPALILPSPPRNRTEMCRHLLEAPSSDLFSGTSPVSVEELSGIRVSDIDQISTSILVKCTPTISMSGDKDTEMTTCLMKSMSPSLILTDLDFTDHSEDGISVTKFNNDFESNTNKNQMVNIISQFQTINEQATLTPKQITSFYNDKKVKSRRGEETFPTQSNNTKEDNRYNIKCSHHKSKLNNRKPPNENQSQQGKKQQVLQSLHTAASTKSPYSSSSKHIHEYQNLTMVKSSPCQNNIHHHPQIQLRPKKWASIKHISSNIHDSKISKETVIRVKSASIMEDADYRSNSESEQCVIHPWQPTHYNHYESECVCKNSSKLTQCNQCTVDDVFLSTPPNTP